MAKLTKKDIKAAAAKAAAKAREKAGKAAEVALDKASSARKALLESKARRPLEGALVVGGGVAAGGLHGSDIKIGDKTEDPEALELPAGAVAGPALAVLGHFAKIPELEALGAGMAAFGVGRIVEDKIREGRSEQSTTTKAKSGK